MTRSEANLAGDRHEDGRQAYRDGKPRQATPGKGRSWWYLGWDTERLNDEERKRLTGLDRSDTIVSSMVEELKESNE